MDWRTKLLRRINQYDKLSKGWIGTVIIPTNVIFYKIIIIIINKKKKKTKTTIKNPKATKKEKKQSCPNSCSCVLRKKKKHLRFRKLKPRPKSFFFSYIY